jgi:hypothetical protein
MIIHSNTLVWADFRLAALRAGDNVTVVEKKLRGSRSRARAFEFSFAGNGRHGGQWGTQDYKVATWDEWGMALAHLFSVDPQAFTRGMVNYESANHFHWTTGDRFRCLTPPYQHLRHKWGMGIAGETGDFRVLYCDCGAERRWVSRRSTPRPISIAVIPVKQQPNVQLWTNDADRAWFEGMAARVRARSNT